MRTSIDHSFISEVFLQAAVLIDDQLMWGSSEASISDAEPDEIIVPDEFDFGGDAANPRPEAAKPSSHKIDAEKVVDGFSDLGLICSTYRWTEGHQKFPNSTDKADLLILDWKLTDTETAGETATKFLLERLTADLESQKRLRYITIYTDKKKEGVLSSLNEAFKKNKNLSITLEDNAINLSVKNGPQLWRILYLSKMSTGEDELAKTIVEDFKAFMTGFLPALVMACVADIRERTYEYLYRFNSELDQAAISHFLALRSSNLVFSTASDNFQEYIINLIVSDVSNSLHSSKYVLESSDQKAIERYLKAQDEVRFAVNKDKPKRVIKHLSTFITEDDRAKFEKGVTSTFGKGRGGEVLRGVNNGSKPIHLESASKDSFEELAMIDLYNLHPRKLDGMPQLRTGTIVRRQQDVAKGSGEYLICTQPLCDAVRLSGRSVTFPFLRLKRNRRSFNYIVLEGNKYVYLRCEAKPNKSSIVDFKPKPSSLDIRATKAKDNAGNDLSGHWFTDIDGVRYEWIAELKEIYAQELQNNLAANSSRVGSNKSEWLRGKSR